MYMYQTNKTNVHVHVLLYLLLVVGDDAADKVRLRLVESPHQVGQLLLVELTNRSEHTLPSPLGTKLGSCRVSRVLGMYADYVGSVLPEEGNHWVGGATQKLDNIVIQRVHVLHQPLLTVVLHLWKEGREGRRERERERETERERESE